jgi:SpoVK/Ycf46/Vps4 family AAA+-type ATPase
MLQPIRAKMDGLNTLQLEDNTFKDTLQALVKTHFMQRLGQETNHFEYDIVRGKGRGLVILLHGAPGTGKTLTAESIAAATGQPLLQVTCGDLGLKPKEVDSALKEIFHLASHWKCVLLLDECDIFLTQRNREDVKRNALVSVFLRVLEFYTGVLFLTTNRVGALDEAINSRITWIMDYPPLNWAQTEEIWKTNLSNVKKGNKKLRVDGKGILAFAEDQFYETEDLKNASWNGRRIQNAFKVAVALAYWETYTNDERGEAWLANTNASKHKRRATLTAAHFQS